ncbi:hypothetical protein R6Q59_003734 [Mikania micrantha]
MQLPNSSIKNTYNQLIKVGAHNNPPIWAKLIGVETRQPTVPGKNLTETFNLVTRYPCSFIRLREQFPLLFLNLINRPTEQRKPQSNQRPAPARSDYTPPRLATWSARKLNCLAVPALLRFPHLQQVEAEAPKSFRHRVLLTLVSSIESNRLIFLDELFCTIKFILQKFVSESWESKPYINSSWKRREP